MKIENVTIAGAGTLGSQIAWQTAFSGFNVCVYDVVETGIEASKAFHQQFAQLFMTTRGATQEQIDQAMARLRYTTDLPTAVKDADLISESVPENLEIKQAFYKELSEVAPEKTIFTTNSSTLIPSQIVSAVDRPERFLALHFANWIWDANVGEVMGHPGTAPEIFSRVVEFAGEIGMVPIPIQKEQNGYVLNTLLVPFIGAALDLVKDGTADYESVDKTWMICSQVKVGPLGIVDLIGMETAFNVETLWGKALGDQNRLARAKYIKENFIDQGKMGTSTGEGFYSYPNPSYEDPDFLS